MPPSAATAHERTSLLLIAKDIRAASDLICSAFRSGHRSDRDWGQPWVKSCPLHWSARLSEAGIAALW